MAHIERLLVEIMIVKISNKSSDFSKKECSLCGEADCSSQSLRRGVITQSKHFVVVHDIHPIVPGHALLLTREHKLSMAQIPDDWRDELNDVKRDTTSILSKLYVKPFCFEHGMAVNHVSSGTCVEHAHLHLIPAQVHILNWVQSYCSKRVELKSIDFVQAINNVTSSYLYYEDSNSEGFLLYPERPLPDQFIRRVVAANYSSVEWDWKKDAPSCFSCQQHCRNEQA